MAKFDVYADPAGGYWLDCQADVLRDLNTRLVVPLRRRSLDEQADQRLNPVLRIDGETVVMLTHFAAAIPAKLLTVRVVSLASEEYTIGAALDMLISGF